MHACRSLRLPTALPHRAVPILLSLWLSISLSLWLSISLAGCVKAPQAASPAPAVVPAPNADGSLPGYLTPDQMPNSLALVPPPPAPGSAALALDEAVSRAAYALKDSARWKQAAIDSNVSFPAAAANFSCALGVPINETDTPAVYRMMRRVLTDAGNSTSAAKKQYKRIRPFVVHDQTLCTPEIEADLRSDYSYPSGHNALGWAYALILTEMAPDRGDALLNRGHAFGDNRMVCNAHWQTDALQGRVMGAAVVSRLQRVPAFHADVERGRAEIARAREKGLPPNAHCQAEAAALAIPLVGAL